MSTFRGVYVVMANSVKVFGLFYESKSRLLKEYGISAYRLNLLLEAGMSVEDAILDLERRGLTNKSRWLMSELNKKNPGYASGGASGETVYNVSDGLTYVIGDVEYSGLADVGKAYNISLPTLRSRLSLGMTMELAVSKRYLDRNNSSRVWYAYKGQLYRTLRDLADHLNMKDSTFRKKYNRGAYTGMIEEYVIRDDVAAGEVSDIAEIYIDYEGYRYVTIDEFLSYYGVRIGEYADLLEKGYSRELSMNWLRANGRSRV